MLPVDASRRNAGIAMRKEAPIVLATRKPETTADRLAAEIARKSRDSSERERVVARLRSRVQAYERQFNIRSGDIHRAIDAGELRETSDICRWIMDYDVLVRAGKA
ncbi:MAG: hypothetical protein JNM64_05675 [Chloroflexia bacterium]|nr:hypothetical protein [Chloroflexia bacterium]